MTESANDNDEDIKPNYSILFGASETGAAEKHICPECNAGFPEKVYLNIHKRKEHPDIYAPLARAKATKLAQQVQYADPNREMKIEFMDSRRGGVFLCVNDFVFARRRKAGAMEYYNCKKSNCPASVRVKEAKVVPGTLKENHNHPNHRDEINRLKLVHNIRERVANDPHINIKTIFKEEREKLAAILGVDPTVEFPTLSSLNSTLYRRVGKGSSTSPSLPQVHQSSGDPELWMNTNAITDNGISGLQQANEDIPNSSTFFRF